MTFMQSTQDQEKMKMTADMLKYLSNVDKEKELQSEKHLHEAIRQRQQLDHSKKEVKKKGE